VNAWLLLARFYLPYVVIAAPWYTIIRANRPPFIGPWWVVLMGLCYTGFGAWVALSVGHPLNHRPREIAVIVTMPDGEQVVTTARLARVDGRTALYLVIVPTAPIVVTVPVLPPRSVVGTLELEE
jgi:hypothetical protein